MYTTISKKPKEKPLSERRMEIHDYLIENKIPMKIRLKILAMIHNQDGSAVEKLKYQVMLHKETAKEYHKLIKAIDEIFGSFK